MPHILGIFTLVVSVLVLVVSYSQWRTANQKVVVDLYDRRLKVYNEIAYAVGEVVREGDVRGDSFVAFATGQANAQFLFGRVVRDYLQDLRKNFALISSYRDEVIEASPQREKLIDKKYDALQRIC